MPRWLKGVTLWLLLATGLFLGVQAWQRQQEQSRLVVSGSTVELRRGVDGHYHWPGLVNGREVDFLVDTGASATAIPAALARELRLQAIDQQTSQTAAGVVRADVVVADVELEGGVQAHRLRMAAMQGLASPLLGMDVLGKLRWEQRDGVLRVHLRGGR